jgi:hypothetical protein
MGVRERCRGKTDIAKSRRFRKIATQNYGCSAFFRKADGQFFSFGA